MSVLDLFRLDGQVALVTGGAQGLGKAMSYALAEAGAVVYIADLNYELAQETAQALSKAVHRKCPAIKADVTKRSDVDHMVQQVIAQSGRIDILVNNAGICRNVAAEEMGPEDWHDVIDLNLNAVFYCAQRVGQEMIKQGQGNIINIASMSGLIVNYPQPQSAYNASKAGVIMLTKSLAGEWAQYGIRVNSISPGYMETAMTRESLQTDMAREHWIGRTPLQRPGRPEELAGTVVYLASEASSFTTGHNLVVDGGYVIW